MIRKCPRCQQNYSVAYGNSDYVHECNSGDSTRDNEDVVVLGDWEDYTGSGKTQPAHISIPVTNTLLGTDAGIYGGEDFSKTNRGNKVDTHRTRQHLQFIEIKSDKNGNNC